MKPWIYDDADGLETVWETDLLPLLEEHHSGDGTDVPGRYGLEVVRGIAAKRTAAAAAQATIDEDESVAAGPVTGAELA